MDFLKNEILKALVERDIEVIITKKGFKIEGFYKSGSILLVLNEDGETFTAHCRYDEKEEIYNFDDLVYLNKAWWSRSRERSDGWANPDPAWVEDMERLGLIKKEINTVYKEVARR